MLKITAIPEDNETVTLQLEGRIVREWVDEVRRECERSLAERSRVILDLSGVTFLDDQGIKLLKTLEGDCVRLSRCSTFLAALLKEEG